MDSSIGKSIFLDFPFSTKALLPEASSIQLYVGHGGAVMSFKVGRKSEKSTKSSVPIPFGTVPGQLTMSGTWEPTSVAHAFSPLRVSF